MNEETILFIVFIAVCVTVITLWWVLGYGRTTDRAGKQLSNARKSVERTESGITEAERTTDRIGKSVEDSKGTVGTIEEGNRTMQDVLTDNRRILDEIRKKGSVD